MGPKATQMSPKVDSLKMKSEQLELNLKNKAFSKSCYYGLKTV